MGNPKGLAIVKHNGLEIAQLYKTKIAVVDAAKNEVTLNSGGWKTKHTKKCMNIALEPYGLYVKQKDFEWYIITSTGYTVPFVDGVTVSL